MTQERERAHKHTRSVVTQLKRTQFRLDSRSDAEIMEEKKRPPPTTKLAEENG